MRREKRTQEVAETLQSLRVQTNENNELMQEAMNAHPEHFEDHLSLGVSGTTLLIS